jgi:hypothetical protein
MIEKKISYDEPKPTKVPNIKPVKQGGRLNYLGKQKTVTAPIKWKSGPTHPITHLAYITDEEQKVLVKLNMYKSMKGKPNKGPFGIMSLNDGDGSGGDSGGASGGSGGSDAAGDAGNATGDSAGASGSGGSSGPSGGDGPGGESGTGGADSGPGAGPGDTMGSSTAQDTESNQQAAASNVTADNVSTQAQADQEDAATAAAANAANQTGIMSNVMNVVNNLMSTYAKYSTIGMIGQAIGNIAKGVTSPDDYSQVDTSVQSTPSTPSTGNGEGIKQYAQLYNTSTGDNTADALRARLNALIQEPQPTVYGLPSINPYSNYTLLDLKNLRR